MYNKAVRKCILLVTGWLLASACLAGPVERSQIMNQCRHISSELMQWVHRNPTQPCVEKVELSAKYVNQAVNNIQQEKIQQALAQVNHAVKELNGLSFQSQCLFFAKNTKPDLLRLAQVSNLIQLIDQKAFS